MKQYVTGLKINHSAAVEVTEDFELPDYRPEIRKAVGTQCTVTKDSAFLEGNAVEVSGCVLYTVLYMSSEGGLTSVPLYSAWSAGVPLPEEGGIGTDDLYMTAECENVTCRITGPRKLTLSARVRLRCSALGETDCTAETDEKAKITLHTEETATVMLKTCRQTGTAGGEITGESPAACRGSVQISEARVTPEGIAVTGEAVLRMLAPDENGSHTILRCRAPISETIPCPRLPENAGAPVCSASGKCAALTITPGEDGIIRWEMEYDLEAAVLAEGTSAHAADGYCTTHEDTPVFRQTEAVTGGRLIRGQVTLTGEKNIRSAPQGEDAAGLQFLYGWGRGSFEKGERLPGGRILLTGTAHCTVLLTGNGDVLSEEAALPIRYECEWTESDTPADNRLTDCRCSFTILDVGGHMDGNVLRLHAEAACDGVVFTKEPCSWLQSLTCHADRPLPPARPAVILYTPEPAETPWDIQKRYRTDNITESAGRFIIRR